MTKHNFVILKSLLAITLIISLIVSAWSFIESARLKGECKEMAAQWERGVKEQMHGLEVIISSSTGATTDLGFRLRERDLEALGLVYQEGPGSTSSSITYEYNKLRTDIADADQCWFIAAIICGIAFGLLWKGLSYFVTVDT